MANIFLNTVTVEGSKNKIADFLGNFKANTLMLLSSFADDESEVRGDGNCFMHELYNFDGNSLQLTFQSKKFPPIEGLNRLSAIYPELEFRIISFPAN